MLAFEKLPLGGGGATFEPPFPQPIRIDPAMAIAAQSRFLTKHLPAFLARFREPLERGFRLS